MSYYILPVETATDNDRFVDILYKNLYPAGGARDRNHWMYESMPSIKRLLYSTGDNMPIGAIGFQLRPFITPFGVKLGALAIDLCVNEEHRNLQAALFFVTAAVNDMLEGRNIDFVYTIPNKNSTLVIKRTKLFTPIGKFERHVKLLKMNELFAKKGCGFASPVANALYGTASYINNMRHRVYPSRLHPLEGIDASWFTYNNEETKVIGIRDSNYLGWRYLKTPDSSYKMYHISHREEHAHLVYKVIKNRAYVVDLLYPQGNVEIVTKLFATFESQARSSGYSMVVIQHLGADDVIQELSNRLWYKKYDTTNKELLVASKDKTLLNYLVNGEKYWFAGDEDDIQ